MTLDVAVNTIRKSLRDLLQKTGPLNDANYSAEIIINGAFAVLKKFKAETNQRQQKAEYENDDPRQTLKENLTSYLRLHDSAREIPQYVEIVETFAKATLHIVRFSGEKEVNWVKEGIYELVENGECEEIIRNYFIKYHHFDPFIKNDENGNQEY